MAESVISTVRYHWGLGTFLLLVRVLSALSPFMTLVTRWLYRSQASHINMITVTHRNNSFSSSYLYLQQVKPFQKHLLRFTQGLLARTELQTNITFGNPSTLRPKRILTRTQECLPLESGSPVTASRQAFKKKGPIKGRQLKGECDF